MGRVSSTTCPPWSAVGRPAAASSETDSAAAPHATTTASQREFRIVVEGGDGSYVKRRGRSRGDGVRRREEASGVPERGEVPARVEDESLGDVKRGGARRGAARLRRLARLAFLARGSSAIF